MTIILTLIDRNPETHGVINQEGLLSQKAQNPYIMFVCLPACLLHLRSAGSAARTSNKNMRAVPLILFVYNKGSIGASLQISEHQQMQQKQQFADSIRDPGILQNIFKANICDPSNSTNTSQVKYYNLKKYKLLFFYLWIFYFIVLLIFYRSWRIGQENLHH